MIASFRHKGLRKYFDSGSLAGIQPAHAKRLQMQLAALDTADVIDDMYTCIHDADALVISTDWDEFKSPDFAKMADLMKGKVIFDGRNLYRQAAMKDAGFTYYSVGRAPVKPLEL